MAGNDTAGIIKNKKAFITTSNNTRECGLYNIKTIEDFKTAKKQIHEAMLCIIQ